MVTWIEVATIAFIAQLTVLLGEKVQFIIAGLSTRYHPLVVVSAAGTAFASWTVLEIILGNFLQEIFSELFLDIITASLFLLFSYLLIRSVPESGSLLSETDGGLVGIEKEKIEVTMPLVDWKIPRLLGNFFPILAMMFAGEFGDKTQLITIGLASQYQFPTAIWIGEMLAIIPVSLINAYFFFTFSHKFDIRKAHFAGAIMFAFFGFDTLQSKLTGISIWEILVGEVGNLLGILI